MRKTIFPATAGSPKRSQRLGLKFFLILRRNPLRLIARGMKGIVRSCLRRKPRALVSGASLIFIMGFALSFARAEELTQQAKTTAPILESKDNFGSVTNTEPEKLDKVSNGTRIIITTSGPAKFSSHWLDNPFRLVVEFQTKNVVSKIADELLVNEGVIKKITSQYYSVSAQQKPLKSLTFELLEKVPYKIWQEENNIILDFHDSLTVPINNEQKEVFVKDESREQIVKRLEAMGIALSHVPEEQPQAAPSKLISKTNSVQRKTIFLIVFWFIGLISISSVGLLVWLFWRRYKLILDKNLAVQEISNLKTQLQKQNQLLEQEEIIRKTVENTSLQREKEFDQLRLELQTEQQLLEQEQKARRTAEEGVSQKEKEAIQIKASLESLKEVLVEKGIAKRLTAIEEKGELWIADKSPNRREFSRLDLSKDYNRTIILRIESADKSKSIKSFANNIGLGGVCFETRHELNLDEKLIVRLFFFGDKIPMMRIQAKVIWSKIDTPVNRYGISFTNQEENKTNLSHYIESKRDKNAG